MKLPSLLLALTAATAFAQGPLTPPGAPAPTMKTLDQIEPRTAINATKTPGDADSLFKITQPGSYYLTGNITGVVGKHGIEIAASGVTLDLMGFDLAGVPAMGAFDGVNTSVTNLINIAVFNGSLRNWGGDGVDLSSLPARNSRVDHVCAAGNAGNGISTGNGCIISACTVYLNGDYGIFTSDSCVVSNCSAYTNTGIGIRTDRASTISNCVACFNESAGIVAFGTGSTISTCSAGFNTGIGFSTGNSCTVSTCTAYSNDSHGISTQSSSTVEGCTSASNNLDGIRCISDCLISGNNSSGNGFGTADGAAIHATFSNNRIEGNNCTGADRGIDMDMAGNIIIRNTCSGNTTNWTIVAGNVCLVVQGITGGAITGDTGGVAPGSTDPGANFTY